MITDQKSHWETVYTTKQPHEVSWTQEKPTTSLNLIQALSLDDSARIIDVGGGDSLLVDFLLEAGYKNITVLDISASALERAKNRLGDKSKFVEWIVSNITDFKPTKQYDVWHDRATFHFLTQPNQIETYQDMVSKAVTNALIVATFSPTGPLKCSGLEIKNYSAVMLSDIFKDSFQLTNSIQENHTTPFETEQNFIFCQFKKINA